MTSIAQRFLSTTAPYLPTTYNALTTRYDNMPFRRAGRSGLLLPSISLGLWQNFGDADPIANSRSVLRRSFDLGITHFDLANNYGPPQGAAERTFGLIFNADFRSYRDEMVISTKAGYDMWPGPYGEWGSRKYLIASLDQSLVRMGLDYVDVFYSHRPDPETPLEETMGALDHIVRSGKALYVGISNYSPEQTRESCAPWAHLASFINRVTICLTAMSRVVCLTSSKRKASAASFSRRWHRVFLLSVI